MRRSEPSISIAIPTRNSSGSLSLLLSSLTPQLTRCDQIIISDDHSSTQELRRTASLASSHGCQLLRLPDPHDHLGLLGRRSHARNLATRWSSRDIVLYLDADMLVPPRYLETIRSYFRIDDLIMVKGARPSIAISEQARGRSWCLQRASEPPRHVSREYAGGFALSALLTLSMPHSALSRRKFLLLIAGLSGCLFYKWHRSALSYSSRWDWCASNNLSVPRVAITRAGLWDENFFGWGEEDMDIAYRLFSSGVRPVLPKPNELWAYHLDHNLDSETRRAQLCRNASYLVAKYPMLLSLRAPSYQAYGLVVDLEAGTVG